jgi:hypothetical protein
VTVTITQVSDSEYRDRFGVAKLTDKINASLDVHFWRWAALFTILFLACSIERGLRTKLWSDELYTIYMAKLASAGDIIALNDASPPLYPIIAHWLLPIIGNDALAVRLPTTLGYCAMILGVLAFCRRRLPAAFAFGAALLACERTVFYATEGRTYGLVLGCAAGALLFWQMAAEGRKRGWAIALLALCCALMVALHYYAIFLLVPLALAEAVRWRDTGRPDLGVWAAMLPAPLVLASHYVLFVASQEYQAHFWAQASLADIAAFYARFLLPPLILCGLAFSVGAFLPGSSAHRSEQKETLPLHEWTAVVALVFMPAVVVLVAMFTTHVFHERYILWAVIGFALLGATALSVAVRGHAAVGVVLAGLALAGLARLEIGPLLERPVLREGEGVSQELSAIASDGAEPILVANAHVFMELSYYLAPPLRERLIYPLSRELDLKHLGFDTDAISLGSLGRRAQIRVKAYDEVLADRKSFLLAAVEGDYLPQHLTDKGYRITPLRGATTLYHVQAPDE